MYESYWTMGTLHNYVTPGEFNIWVFPKIGVPQNWWFIMENPIKNGWFGGTTIFGNIHIDTKNNGLEHIPRSPKTIKRIGFHQNLLF